MDVVSYAKAAAVDKRLTDSINAGQTLSSWTADRDAINAKLADASKISQTLINGTSVINATLDAPATVEVQGRTLVSMGSSVLQNGKQFLLADKKTKIRTLGKSSAQTQGVAKFVQTVPTSDTATFAGKVSASVVENPHISKYMANSASSTTLQTPSGTWTGELGSPSYGYLVSSGTGIEADPVLYNGGIAQILFSFNIIEEIERKLGRVPGVTTADKVAWCKSNLNDVKCNWWGYGSSPTGNKATLKMFNVVTNQWVSASSNPSTTNGTVTNLLAQALWLASFSSANVLDSNGFVHVIAYTDPSDGVTSSVINTDYVECIIILNSGAQLDNRPILTRVANLEGKVGGSTVENPHNSKYTPSYNTLLAPSSSSWTEANNSSGSQANYTNLAVLNQNNTSLYTMTPVVSSGAYSQQLFQFDIIQEIERQLGRIPKATLADKVQWCKDNIATITANWYGWGSGPNGYKAYFVRYLSGAWNSNDSLNAVSASTPSLISWATSVSIPNMIDANGFANFLAYADAAAVIPNPTVAPILTASGSGGGLAAGTYYVQYTWNSANGETLVSPENSITITAGQTINITVPTIPFGVQYAKLYMSTTSGTETAQATTATTTYSRVSALTAGSAIPTTNTSIVTSTINTDYVELQIELKNSAVLYDPVVPLYQIDDTTEYTNILTTWLEAEVLNRYPKVQSVEHLQNVYAIAEGENLIPPFSDPAWVLHANAVATSSTLLTLNATANAQVSYVDVPVKASQAYTISLDVTNTCFLKIELYDASGTRVSNPRDASYTGTPYSFTADATAVKVRVTVYGYNGAGTYTFTNLIMTVGSTAKPFTPRNPSYLFATNKLGQIGTVKDMLYKSDGQWYIRKAIEKDVVLDGSLAWVWALDYTGYKAFKYTVAYPTYSGGGTLTGQGLLTKYDSKKCTNYNVPIAQWTVGDTWAIGNSSAMDFFVTVSDSDSGFGDAYNPNNQEIQAYFYGWQAKTVDVNGKPTAWRSIGDGTDAPTQTLAYVSVNKAPNFTPYKLSYQLVTPQVLTATVEGDIALNGPTQIEVGSGVIVREKVIPKQRTDNAAFYSINTKGQSPYADTRLKYPINSIISVYKNGIKDTGWITGNDSASYGATYLYTPTSNFDATAEYTVSYKVNDKDNTKAAFTSPPLEFKTTYDTTLKSVVDHVVEKLSDVTVISSVNVQAIADTKQSLNQKVSKVNGTSPDSTGNVNIAVSSATWHLLQTISIPATTGALVSITNIPNAKEVLLVAENVTKGTAISYCGISVNGATIAEIRSAVTNAYGVLRFEDKGIWDFEYGLGAQYGSAYNMSQASFGQYTSNGTNIGGAITSIGVDNLASGTIKVYAKY